MNIIRHEFRIQRVNQKPNYMSTLEKTKTRVKIFLKMLPKEWREIGGFKQQEPRAADTLEIYVADLTKSWKIPGLKFPLTNQKIRISIPSDNTDSATIKLEGIIQNNNQDVLFSGELNRGLEVTLQAEKEVTLNTFDFSNYSTNEITGIVEWTERFSLSPTVALKIVFQPAEDRMFIYNHLSAELKSEYCIEGTNLCLSNPSLLIDQVYDLSNSELRPSLSGRIKALLTIEKQVNIEVELTMFGFATLTISGVNDEGLPGPSDLLKAIGFEKEGLVLEKAIEANKFLRAPYIDSVAIRFNLKTKKFLSGSVLGHIEVSTYKVRFGATFPNVILSVSLDPETPIILAEMIKDTYPELNDLPAELKVSRASAQLMIEPLDFRFDLSLSDLWKTKIGAMDVEFKELEIGINIVKDKPVTGRIATLITLGEVDFGLLGERIAEGKKTGWHFQTQIAHSNPIKLKAIVNELTKEFGLANADWLPETELSNITLDLNTLKETFELKASAKIKDKVGPFETIAVDLHIKVDKKDKDLPLSIKIDGKLKLDTSLIQFKTNFGNKNWFIDANWEKDKDEKGLDLLDFVREIDQDKNLDLSNVPDAIEKGLTLQKMAFSYHNESKALVLSATNELGITLKFSLIKSGKIGAILGLKYDHKLNESEVGKSLEIFEKDIAFKEAWLVLSWIPDGFEAPKKGDFAKGWPMAIEEMGKGVLLSAKMEIKDSATGAFKLLNDSVPNSPASFQITGQLQFAPFLTKLKLAYDGEINFKTNGDHPLTIKDCAIEIEIGPTKASIDASGILRFYVDELIVESRISFGISTQGIELGLSIEFNKGVPLFGLRDVQLHKVEFSLGVGFGPPSVRLGAGVEMTFREKQGVKDYFGLILGFTGPIPIPEYVGMDIAKISLNELIENLEANKGKKSFLPDKMAEIKAFSFVWALKDRTKLPDGSTVNAGVAFHGLLTLNNWNAWFEFQANPSIGISGKGQFEKIDVEGFSVKGNAPEIKRQHYKQGNEWLPVSNAKRVLTGVVTKSLPMLKGGGAIIQFSTYKSPYFLVNFDIRLLDVIRAKADVAVTDSGMKFKLVANIPNLYYLDHSVELKSDKTFLSKGSFSAGIGGEIKILFMKFYVGIKGSQEIRRGADGSFYFHFSYKYDFLDIKIPGPNIEIPYAPKNFEQIVDIIWQNFTKNIYDNLVKIILDPTYKSHGGQAIRTLKSGPKRRRMRTSAPQTILESKLTWMDEALNEEKKKAPMGLKSGDPSQRMKKLLDKANEQTRTEIKEMNELHTLLDEGHNEMISNAESKLKRHIQIAKLETKHLQDEDHALENKVHLIWEKLLINYKNLKFRYFDSQANHLEGLIDEKSRDKAKAELEKNETRINAALEKITNRIDLELGYKIKKETWVKIAVDHYAEMARIAIDADIEIEYLMLQKMKSKKFFVRNERKPKQTIIIKA